MTRTRNVDLYIAGIFILLGFALYLSGLHAPWYFDDFRNIVDNPLIVDAGQALREIFEPRGVTFFTFALNYALGGMDPAAFRVVNILLHVASSLLVWLILRRVFRDSHLLPVVGGLLFLVHPVQTQAVTYIVQRMASLGACFFLLAVYCHIRMREATAEGERWHCRYWQAGTLFAFVLALWSKQNTIVLPVVLLCLDYCILDRDRFNFRASLLRIFPLLLLVALALLQQMMGVAHVVETLSAKAQIVTERMNGEAVSGGTMPLRYFATELIVFWVYIKLLLFPVGQMLDYSWPVVATVFNWRSAVALAGFVLVFFVARGLRLWNRQAAFGVAWIVLTLAVESSFLPLDPIYEHRLYLPMLGVVVLALGLLVRWCPSRRQVPVMAVVLIVLATLTVSRNALWADSVAFWKDNLAKVPTSSRVMSNLGQAYQERGDYQAAVDVLQQAQALTPDNAIISAGIGNGLLHLGRLDEARAAFERALQLDPDNALANSYLGSLCVSANETARGVALLERAVALAPTNSVFLQNLAVGLELSGRRVEAENVYRRGLTFYPDNSQFLLGLGTLLDAAGRSNEGLVPLARALQSTPNDAKILYYYGLTALHAGERDRYRSTLEQLRRLDVSHYRKLQQMEQ